MNRSHRTTPLYIHCFEFNYVLIHSPYVDWYELVFTRGVGRLLGKLETIRICHWVSDANTDPQRSTKFCMPLDFYMSKAEEIEITISLCVWITLNKVL